MASADTRPLAADREPDSSEPGELRVLTRNHWWSLLLFTAGVPN